MDMFQEVCFYQDVNEVGEMPRFYKINKGIITLRKE